MTRLFGTNGIRGIVNKEMTGELALGIGQAWGTFLKRKTKNPRVAIGTDARLSCDMLQSAITSGLLATGCFVVDVGMVPTPTLQYTVREKKFDSGVMITASHNPPQFNGIKGVDSDGTEFSKETEEAIEHLYFNKIFYPASWKEIGSFSSWDKAIEIYLKAIVQGVDSSCIRKHGFHVVLDCGSGSGGVVTPLLLKQLGCRVTPLYCQPNGTFPGHHSEPIPENLHELMKTVQETHADLGVAQDGDADRAIFIDEKGAYIWGDKSLALIGKYMIRQKKGGTVVTPVTTSTCFEDVINAGHGKVIFTRVGSPIVARVMKQHHAVFGGEENGGLIFPEMQYCRDSAMTLAKMLELLAKEKRPLSSLVADLPRYALCKMKVSCPNEKKERIMESLTEHVHDEKVMRVDNTDGVKLFFKSGWVLVRPSGTEPIIRIFAEAKELRTAQNLAQRYKIYVETLAAI
jgi:phosphomannomutase/phosphoglucomutase